MRTRLEKRVPELTALSPMHIWGTISHIAGQSIEVDGLSSQAGLGQLIAVHIPDGHDITGEVIALNGPKAIIMMHQDPQGLRIGQQAHIIQETAICPSEAWRGQVLNYKGQAFDGWTPPQGEHPINLNERPPEAVLRKPIGSRLHTGIAAFDTFLPLCQGQRVGLFAGSGVGKSTLLAELAKGSAADITILALIGERGREVRTFVDKTLGPEGMKKSVVFVATSDMPAALKLRTALLAMACAEYFRDQGQQVLFLCDSLTRYAEAHRDMALTAGEVPSLRAYPPSTFRALAALCERAGPGPDNTGDITAVFSVLVAGSNMEEPVADMVRGILDGHVILSRDIAERGRYPAIDIRRSVSRSLPEAASAAENQILQIARAHIGRFEDARPLIQSGLYTPGTEPELDQSIRLYPQLDAFIKRMGDPNIQATFDALADILKRTDQTGEAAATDRAALQQG